jgi:hypothetical protein
MVARSLAVDEVLEQLESFLHLIVALRARRRLFVRAAVAGWEGQAILILGPRSSGKSTLLAELIRTGATYYSDRYAVLDSKGRVHPYPTPLPHHIQQGTGIAFLNGTGEDLGGKRAPRPLPVGLVVDTHYQAGAKCRYRLLSAGAALCLLLKQAVNARSRPQTTLASLHQTATQARVVRGKRGEAGEAALALLRQIGTQVYVGNGVR